MQNPPPQRNIGTATCSSTSKSHASGNAAFAVVVGALWAFRSKPLFGKFEELLMSATRMKVRSAKCFKR
jgi:transposase-like protein